MFSVSKPSYVQVIQDGSSLSVISDFGCDLYLHAVESSKSPFDDDLKDIITRKTRRMIVSW